LLGTWPGTGLGETLYVLHSSSQSGTSSLSESVSTSPRPYFSTTTKTSNRLVINLWAFVIVRGNVYYSAATLEVRTADPPSRCLKRGVIQKDLSGDQFLLVATNKFRSSAKIGSSRVVSVKTEFIFQSQTGDSHVRGSFLARSADAPRKRALPTLLHPMTIRLLES
jgi:hypothetical protein